jgi:hypothetical protein
VRASPDRGILLLSGGWVNSPALVSNDNQAATPAGLPRRFIPPIYCRPVGKRRACARLTLALSILAPVAAVVAIIVAPPVATDVLHEPWRAGDALAARWGSALYGPTFPFLITALLACVAGFGMLTRTRRMP